MSADHPRRVPHADQNYRGTAREQFLTAALSTGSSGSRSTNDARARSLRSVLLDGAGTSPDATNLPVLTTQ